MKNCMYINRKRVADWQRETYRSTQYMLDTLPLTEYTYIIEKY